jgi:hypothetical protein
MDQFGFGKEVATLTISLFIAGYCLGPLVWGPLSEDVSRVVSNHSRRWRLLNFPHLDWSPPSLFNILPVLHGIYLPSATFNPVPDYTLYLYRVSKSAALSRKTLPPF